jgi:MFS family permease
LYSLAAVFSLSYLTATVGISRTLALIALSIGGACNALTIPLFGSLSDRFGRRTVYGAGVVCALVVAFMFFPLLDTRSPVAITCAIAAALVVHAMMYGPQAAFIAEQFPTRVRYAGSSLAYTLAGIVGGGIAPVVLATLHKAYGGTHALSVYLAAALLVTGIVLMIARERAGAALE